MRFILVSCFLLLSILNLSAQKKPAKSNLSPEVTSIEATVKKMFDGMRKGDSAMVRSVLAKNVRFYGVGTNKNGETVLRESPAQGFLTAVGTPHSEVWDERIWDGKTEIDGDLATYWCQYAFYLGDKFSHCGVDAFQLYRTKEGWKIFLLTDTRRKENCDLAAKSR